MFLIIIINLVVIKITKIIISREVVTSYLIAVKEANPEIIIPIKVPEILKVLKVVLRKPISLPDYLILISLYYANIKIITPLEA